LHTRQRAGRTDRRQPLLAQEMHAHELIAPGRSRQNVGGRKRVAAAARDAGLLLIGLRRAAVRGGEQPAGARDHQRRCSQMTH
jgi:hypothetical protein